MAFWNTTLFKPVTKLAKVFAKDYFKVSEDDVLTTIRSIKLPYTYRVNTSNGNKNELYSKLVSMIRDDFYFKQPLIVSGPKTYDVLGKQIYKTLEELSLKPEKYIYKDERLTLESALKCKKEIPKTDCIFAVGGGKIIDLGKYLSYHNSNLISVPTAMTNDGIASGIVSMQNKTNRISQNFKNPNAVICDYGVLKESPKMNAGVGDAIAKYSSTEDWKLAKETGYQVEFAKTFYLGLYGLSRLLIEGAITLGDDYATNERYLDHLLMLFGVSAAAMSNAGGKTFPSSGSEHALSHSVDYLFPDRKDVLHGEQCGMFTILTSYLHGKDWDDVKAALTAIGAPTTLKGIGVEPTKENLEAIFNNSKRKGRYTILDVVTLEKFKKAAKKTGIV